MVLLNEGRNGPAELPSPPNEYSLLRIISPLQAFQGLVKEGNSRLALMNEDLPVGREGFKLVHFQLRVLESVHFLVFLVTLKLALTTRVFVCFLFV